EFSTLRLRLRSIRDFKAENAHSKDPLPRRHEDHEEISRRVPARGSLHRIHRRVDASWRAGPSGLRAFVHASCLRVEGLWNERLQRPNSSLRIGSAQLTL